MKICYYAHSVALYGTKQEERDLETLWRLGFEVENPATPFHSDNYAIKGMDYFKNIIEACDVLAFRAHVDLYIGAGVAKEIGWAKDAGLPIIELPSVMSSRMIDIEQTKEYLKEVGQR
jgi:hypothetical protein